MRLREYGVQHAVLAGPHGTERCAVEQMNRYAHRQRLHPGSSDDSRESVHHILDVTLVGDDCIMFVADDPKSTASAIDCCTLVLSATFQLLNLEVNLREAKTERLVHMVVTSSTEYQRRRPTDLIGRLNQIRHTQGIMRWRTRSGATARATFGAKGAREALWTAGVAHSWI